MVYIESFYVSPFRDSRDGRWKVNQEGVDVNYKLRGALEMALDRHAIPYSFVAPQAWKNAVVGDGMAEKAVIKEIIERKMGFRFPPRLFFPGQVHVVESCCLIPRVHRSVSFSGGTHSSGRTAPTRLA